jgi:tRNA-specific 2-thiouridylase
MPALYLHLRCFLLNSGMAKIIALALSGGVDSSAAALLLREKYGLVIGASHYIWPESRCCSLDAFNRARYICNLLNMPYYIIDLADEFKRLVVDDFVTAYCNGLTPNPCVLCNGAVRFTLFYERLKKKCAAEGLLPAGEQLRFATGHYVQLEETALGLFLRKALDPAKDQSYMLYRLPRELLPFFEFPLGAYLKSEVVALARTHGLRAGMVAESQDACFVDTTYVDFIKEQGAAPARSPSGEIRDTQGNVLGNHSGYLSYTVGQRRGLGLGNGPWYVTDIDPEKNLVTVGRREQSGRRDFLVQNLNWFIPVPEKPMECSVKIRYRSQDVPCVLEAESAQKVWVCLEQPELVTPGQSAVFYQDDLVLGGGIIQKAEK